MIRAICLAASVALAAAADAQVPADALRVEMVFWESIRASKDPADYRAYLEQYPSGRFAPLARNRLAALGHPVPAPAAPAPVAAAPAPQPSASAAAAGPLAAGNAWTYRVLDRTGAQRGLQQVTLAAATADSLVEDILADGANTRAEHRKGYYLSAAGNVTLFSPYLGALDALPPPGPLGDIDVLDMRTCNAGWSCSVRGRVVGREHVQVPAGAFEATKIEIVQSWLAPPISYSPGEGVTRTLTVWYAPEVKRAVKFSGRGGRSRSVETEFDIELVSALGGGPAPARTGRLPREGDTWTYRLAEPKGVGEPRQRTYVVNVAAASEAEVVDRYWIDGEAAGQWVHKGERELVGLGKSLFAPYLLAFGEPPVASLGRPQILDCGSAYVCEATARATRWEKVQVPAGMFDALRVEVEQSWRPSSISGAHSAQQQGGRRLIVWYARETKRAVKFSSRATVRSMAPIDPDFELELTSYQLK